MMKKITFTLLIILSVTLSYSQQIGCDGNRFFSRTFENVTITQNIQYGQNTSLGGNSIDLLLDVYEPEDDNLEKRPLIVFAHGGGFLGGNKGDVEFICEDFAQKGFVTASISYRLIDGIITDSTGLAEAIIMAAHDMKAAVRYFREDATYENQFKIDPEYIFAGGVSAGAVMANLVGFLDPSDELPSNILEILEDNGGLEGNSSSNVEFSSEVQGVLNYSGSIADLNLIGENSPPIYSFHDELDTVVPCDDSAGEAFPFPTYSYGSCAIHEVVEELGIKNQLYLRSGSDRHVGWNYGVVLYESTQFLGEVLCESSQESPWEAVGAGMDTPGLVVGDISAVDENTIWTISMFGTQFSRSLDGGQTWDSGTFPFSDPSFKVVGIQALDDQIAWAMALSFPSQGAGKMYKTTDGGLNWTEQSTSFVNVNEGPQVFHFFNENDGFALGQLKNDFSSQFSSHVGYVTSDGGETWEKLESDVYPAIAGERLFVSTTNYMDAKGDHIWFGTSLGSIYHSADRGKTWEKNEVAPLLAIQSVAFKDEMNGICVSGVNSSNNVESSRAFSTSDGGNTWTEIEIPEDIKTRNIHFVEGSADITGSCGTYIAFYGWGGTAGSLITKDGGQNWELVDERPAFCMESIGSDKVWMGGMIHGVEVGGLFRWEGEVLNGNENCLTSIKNLSVKNSDLSIFPNPTKDSLNIKLENDWNGTMSLQIIDLQGKVQIEKVLQKQNPKEAWSENISQLLPGNYQLVISNREKKVATSLLKL